MKLPPRIRPYLDHDIMIVWFWPQKYPKGRPYLTSSTTRCVSGYRMSARKKRFSCRGTATGPHEPLGELHSQKRRCRRSAGLGCALFLDLISAKCPKENGRRPRLKARGPVRDGYFESRFAKFCQKASSRPLGSAFSGHIGEESDFFTAV